MQSATASLSDPLRNERVVDTVHEMVRRAAAAEHRRVVEDLHSQIAFLTAGAHRNPRSAMSEQLLNSLARIVANPTLSVPTDVPLDRFLSDLLRRFAQRADIKVNQKIDPRCAALTADDATQVYGILLEALANVERHAQAATLWVSIRTSGQSPVRIETIEIGDDGPGIPPHPYCDGPGLRIIRERASRLAGNITIGSRPGGACTLSFRRGV